MLKSMNEIQTHFLLSDRHDFNSPSDSNISCQRCMLITNSCYQQRKPKASLSLPPYPFLGDTSKAASVTPYGVTLITEWEGVEARLELGLTLLVCFSAQRGSSTLLKEVASRLPVAQRLQNSMKFQTICACVQVYVCSVSHECQNKINQNRQD